MKICTRCKRELSEERFSRRRDRPIGFVSHCKQCALEQYQDWARRNRGHLQQYYLDNKERYRATGKRFRDNNREQINRQNRERYYHNPEKASASYKRWRQAHLAYGASRRAEYVARKKRAMPTWANTFFMEEIYDLAKMRTQYLGRPYEVDHIVPLKNDIVCGLHCEQNLQIIPAAENQRKRNIHWPNMPVKVTRRNVYGQG